jgi:6-phosphofructokinase
VTEVGERLLHVGWIAVAAGIAGGADQILTPEDPFDIDEIAAKLRHRHRSYATSSIVVAAEGATAKPGALDSIHEGATSKMTALVGDRIELVDIADVAGRLKVVPEDLRRVARALY